MTVRKVSRRWPAEPLIQAVGSKTMYRLFDSGEISRARKAGLTEKQADRWAVKAGFHTSEIWPDMLDAAIDDISSPCGHCGNPFVPVMWKQRFCSTPCRTAAHRRTPVGAANNRERRRRGYLENADYERRAQWQRDEARRTA